MACSLLYMSLLLGDPFTALRTHSQDNLTVTHSTTTEDIVVRAMYTQKISCLGSNRACPLSLSVPLFAKCSTCGSRRRLVADNFGYVHARLRSLVFRTETTKYDVYLAHNWGTDEEGRSNHERVREHADLQALFYRV
eukprot:7277846-Prymnesium_polylepis.1